MDFRLREQSRQSGIVVQAGMLAAASIVVRLIGLLYQAPLTAIIGDEGNGYYSLAYNIYTIVLLISSYSIPSAVSKIMAQKLALSQYRNAQRVFRVAFGYCLFVGGAASVLVFFGANVLVSSNSVPVLRAFAPTIFLFSLLGVLRGYFQAYSSMIQTSVSQILEQIFNAGMSLLMAWVLIATARAGTDSTTLAVRGAIGSALGTGSGVLAALIFMTAVYRMNRGFIREKCESDDGKSNQSSREILSEVMRVVTPFILSSFILNLTTSLNQTVYTKLLMDLRGFGEEYVTTLYGIFSRKATVITNIPISVATAASAAIIPNISSAFATGDREETGKRAENAMFLTAVVSLPSTAGLIFLAEPVTLLLFPQRSSLEKASLLLMMLAVTVFFYSMATISNAVLQATEHMNLPLVSAAAALVIQTVLLCLMLVFTDLDIYALVLASVVYSLMIFICNTLFIRKYLGSRFGAVRMYLPIVAASVIMGAAAFLIYRGLFLIFGKLFFGGMSVSGLWQGGAEAPMRSRYFCNLLSAVPAIAAAIFIYAFLLIKLGAMDEEKIRSLPRGNRLAVILKKIHWLP